MLHAWVFFWARSEPPDVTLPCGGDETIRYGISSYTFEKNSRNGGGMFFLGE